MTTMTVPRGGTAVRAKGSLLAHSWHFTAQSVKVLWRQPVYMLFMLVQPMIWLLMFGQLFQRVVELPGFAGINYTDFLVPGVVVMNAIFTGAWSGVAFVEMMERGIMDRMLTTPVRRGAIIIGSLAYHGLSLLVQGVIVITVGRLAGADYPGGPSGILVTLLASTLLIAAFCSMSNAFGLLLRTREALIGLSQFLTLPLMFLSSAIMAQQAAPDWIRTLSAYNPVDWAVVASREALSASPDWGTVWGRLGALAAVALVLGYLGTRAFGSYQKSL
ncbi:ABC transporter permease [Planomonospora venezuelensis]|uniref:Transport permease protein n=1 Tax=Planomonospora venezuelensis TaxID=1999 RepID=A0A841CYN1_PLAVE|nr:ABC transporter permease [Planomonospora venezuelensis]MBB5962550.1 ABC-2 type transport system permease protein [Planomonospora venezuelensis]GIM99044.1 transport permease protein [Planomonospora venezuelensis]